MRASITAEMLATDHALDLARDGMPFRDAYKTAAAQMRELSDEGIAESLASRTSPGGCGRLETEILHARLELLQK